jgi:hypothetical protein
MECNAYSEGYVDGLTGNGMPDRPDDTPVEVVEYERGFLAGSKDRSVLQRAGRLAYVLSTAPGHERVN